MLKKIIDFVHEFYKSIVYHTLKEKLNNSEIEKIKLNGLIYFCNSKNKDKILQEGVKGGLKEPLMKAEKNFTWYYKWRTKFWEE